jgi:hypothetical protein
MAVPFMDYRAVELDESNASDWEELNEKSPDGSLFHTLKWKQILEKSLGFKPCYFLIYRNNQPVGLCPFYQRRVMGFDGLMSLPDATLNPCNHIILVDRHASTVGDALQKCKDIAKTHKLSFMAFGIKEDLAHPLLKLNMPLHQAGGNMVLDLHQSPPDKIWQLFSNNQRNKIRRFDKDGFALHDIASSGEVDAFCRFYQVNLRHIGGNPHPFRYFTELMRAYSDRSPPEILWTLLRRNEQVAGGLLALLYSAKRTMYWRYLSLNRELPNVYTPFYYVLWHAVRKAVELGYETIDFGGTPPDPSDVHYRMKARFQCRYEKKYLAILPLSRPFKMVYAAQRFVEQYDLLPKGARSWKIGPIVGDARLT